MSRVFEKHYTLDEAAQAAGVDRFVLDRDIHTGVAKAHRIDVPNQYPRFQMSHTQVGSYREMVIDRVNEHHANEAAKHAAEHSQEKAVEHANLKRRVEEMEAKYGFE